MFVARVDTMATGLVRFRQKVAVREKQMNCCSLYYFVASNESAQTFPPPMYSVQHDSLREGVGSRKSEWKETRASAKYHVVGTRHPIVTDSNYSVDLVELTQGCEGQNGNH